MQQYGCNKYTNIKLVSEKYKIRPSSQYQNSYLDLAVWEPPVSSNMFVTNMKLLSEKYFPGIHNFGWHAEAENMM